MAAYVSNERREPFDGEMICRIRDEHGRTEREVIVSVHCPAMSAVRAGEIRPENGEAMPVTQVLLLDGKGNPVSESDAMNVPPKYFPFEKPRITLTCDGEEVRLTADTFCTGVELEAGDARFSDNWVTLYPGEPRVLTADRALAPEEIRIRTLE